MAFVQLYSSRILYVHFACGCFLVLTVSSTTINSTVLNFIVVTNFAHHTMKF